jgi:hypothetical protein
MQQICSLVRKLEWIDEISVESIRDFDPLRHRLPEREGDNFRRIQSKHRTIDAKGLSWQQLDIFCLDFAESSRSITITTAFKRALSMAADALKALEPELIEKIARYSDTSDKSAPKFSGCPLSVALSMPPQTATADELGFKYWTRSWTGTELSESEVRQHFQAGWANSEPVTRTT